MPPTTTDTTDTTATRVADLYKQVFRREPPEGTRSELRLDGDPPRVFEYRDGEWHPVSDAD